MAKLLVSFPKILELQRDRKLCGEELLSSLFYLGGTRDEVWNFPEGTFQYIFHACLDRREECVEVAYAALVCAEESGRIIYRTDGSNQTFEELNGLLERNGYEPVVPPPGAHCTWLVIKELVEKTNLEFEVVV